MAYEKANKLHIVAVTAVIRNAEGKYLVLKRSEREIAHPGKYAFPGGKVENNDTIEEALMKEVAEETGLTMKPGKVPLKDASFVRPDGQTVKVLSFLVEVEKTEPVKFDANDFSDYKWIRPEELNDIPHVSIEEELRRAEELSSAGIPLEKLRTESRRYDA